MIHFDKPSAAILAGGLGTRLRQAVSDRPKVLAPTGGRPFLYRLLDQLWCFAIREVVLLVGHGAEQVRETLGESYHGMQLWYSREPHPLGTAGAVRRALPFLHAPDVLLFNGDSFCEVDLDAFRQHHDDAGATASLVLCRVPDASRYGRVELDGERVVNLVEKGSAGGAAWINAGVYLLRRDRIAAWPEGPLSLERDILPECVAAGGVSGFRAGGRFLDIGTPESYASAEGFFAALEAA
jgi:NDP-sugar pyrophosphorylase family protein